MNLPVFDELHVISDLHLGGPPGRQIFSSCREASALLKHLSSLSNTRVGLVINGDFVDFLAEDDARCFDTDPDSAERKLHAIAGRDGFKPVFNGLRQFVRTGHQLAINLGNHDLELALPWVRRTLLDLLADDDAARGRITLVLDGSGYPARVGSARVICLHGNEVDAWNVTDYEKLRRIGRDMLLGRSVAPWKPNAGSRMVVEVMNGIKRDWPFVDLLKPEREAVPLILIALDPRLSCKVKDIAQFAATANLAALKREAGFLGEEAGGPDNQGDGNLIHPAEAFGSGVNLLASAETRLIRKLGQRVGAGATQALMDDIERQFRAKARPMELLSSDHQAGYLGKMSDLWAATAGWLQKSENDLKNWLSTKGKEVLRKSLECLVEDRIFDLNDATDETYRQIDEKLGPEFDFIITGHTHLERALRRTNGSGFYYNTGTWAGIMQLEPHALQNDVEFDLFYQHLASRSLQVLEQNQRILRKNTVASICVDSTGVTRGELRHAKLNGKALVLQRVPGSESQIA